MRASFLRSLAAVLLLAALAENAHAEGEALARGFVPGKLYDFGAIDAINTFNGNLTLQIPIGPSYPVNGSLSYSLTLSYNSKAWEYEEVYDGMVAVPSRRSNAGMGWLVSLGKIISPTDSTNPSLYWRYESSDGAIREFFDTLHPGDPATAVSSPVKAVRYTRDGTYLRMLEKTDGTMDVEFPDGNVHTFSATTGKLTRMRDRYNSAASVSYSSSMTGTPCLSTDNYVWTITDSKAARTNYVCFSSANESVYPESTYEGQVERIVLAAPATGSGTARTATYVFYYAKPAIARDCRSSSGMSSATVAVPVLTSIALPDATTYAFQYNLTNSSSACESGTLKQVTLPTRATINYAYRFYTVPASDCGGAALNPHASITGVGTKTISGPRIPTSVWTYSSALSTTPAEVLCEDAQGMFVRRPAPAEQMKVTVVDPVGHRTEHFYSVWPGAEIAAPGGSQTEEYGLATSRLESNTSFGAPVYLSSRVYDAAGTLLRTNYARYGYEPDWKGTSCFNFQDCGAANVRVAATRAVHHDDGAAAVEAESSDWDALGHYRRTRIAGTGTLAAGARETFTAYNTRDSEVNPTTGIASGTYTGAGSFTPPPSTTPWLTNLSSYVQVTEGGVSAKTQSCYDATTGFLRGVRKLKATTRDVTDAVAVFRPDTVGNLASEHYFGADVLRNASTTSALCTVATATTLPTVDYRIDHTYQWGVRSTSRYLGASFYHLNRTVDRYTGFPMTSTDSSGLVTTHGYDTAFRLNLFAPPGVSRVTYTYTNATSTAPAQVQMAQGTKKAQYQYDSLGRLWREKTFMPDSTWSVTDTLRDASGNIASQSAQEKLVVTTTEYDFVPSRRTSFGGYDPFRRVGTITTPDSKTTTKSYKGVSSVTTAVSVNGASGEAPVSTTERYDLQGRLVSVTEAAGTAAAYTTSYAYDVGGRLKSVSMPGGTAGTQTRLFTYDNRGFLTSEQHPELGATGNGTKSYPTYDARGNARRQITGTANGAFDLSFTFDTAERVTHVKLTGTGETLKEFDYDDPDGLSYPQCAMGACNGKLAAAARYNYMSDLGGLIAVTESYQYESSGRMSRRDTAVGSTSLFSGDSFNVAQSYNTFGEVGVQYYPCRTDSSTPDGCGAEKPQRYTTRGFTNGWLTGVSPAASAIAYAPNGTVTSITHGSGTTAVTEAIVPDPSGVPRPCGIFVYGPGVSLVADSTAPCGRRLSGTGAQWTSGAYAYDGAGNIKQIGGNTYRYDAFGRLNSWTTAAGTASRSYDAFGNFIATGYAISGTTNRYTSMSYDAAGNVTNDGKGTYTYDALGMMTGANIGTRQFRYLYLPNDERVGAVERVVVGGVVRPKTTWTLRGIGPELQRVYTDDYTSGTRALSWKEDVFWRGGQILGTETPSGFRHYGLDHLGSPRIVTDGNGNLLGYQDFTPFGTGGTSNGGTLQFTGQERDAASLANGSLDMPDYFHARFYRADVGRFLSVDPAIESVRLSMPQTWNRYTYGLNNPMKYVDPTGAIVFVVTHTTGNASGDDEFRQAAETRAAEIRNQEGYDATRDTVLVRGVSTKSEFASVLAEARGLEGRFGRVGSVETFSHSGALHGPIFPRDRSDSNQFTAAELNKLNINWDVRGSGRFFGCNTANFAQTFADAQGVAGYGYAGYANFSHNKDYWTMPFKPWPAPLYLVQAGGWNNGGLSGALSKWAGAAKSVPMVRKDPRR